MSQGAEAADFCPAPAVAASPLMDFTRIVRITPKVLVLPSSLWTTPCRRPRTNTLPFFLENVSGTNLPVTLRSSAVVPRIREVSSPCAVWATGGALLALVRAGGAAVVAELPRRTARVAVTTRETNTASGPATRLLLKFNIMIPSIKDPVRGPVAPPLRGASFDARYVLAGRSHPKGGDLAAWGRQAP